MVTYMSTIPKKSAQIKETCTTIVSPPHNFEQPNETPILSDSPHITIGSESMQVDNTNVIVDRAKDLVKYFGSNIVYNTIDYSSSSHEEKEQDQRKKMDLLKGNLNLALK